MARVICPSPGCQITVMDYSSGPHIPYFGPYPSAGIVIVDGPHRMTATSGLVPSAGYCPHGYDECWQGCCYPGRCGQFNVAADGRDKG